MSDKKVRGPLTDVDKDWSASKEEGTFLRLDIACGNNKKVGFIGVDIAEQSQCDWICNLNYYPWQYKEIVKRHESGMQYRGLQQIPDDSTGEIFCCHYIEHVKDLKKFAQELYRIMKPGTLVNFIAPYYSSVRAMQDPTHVNFISEQTFLYWDAEWIRVNKLEHYDMRVNFKMQSAKFVFENEWTTRSTAAKEWARKHYINVVQDINIVLKKEALPK